MSSYAKTPTKAGESLRPLMNSALKVNASSLPPPALSDIYVPSFIFRHLYFIVFVFYHPSFYSSSLSVRRLYSVIRYLQSAIDSVICSPSFIPSFIPSLCFVIYFRSFIFGHILHSMKTAHSSRAPQVHTSLPRRHRW